VTTASNHISTTQAGRSWVLVLATTGWVVLTTVAVLLATGTWSIEANQSNRSNQPNRPAQPTPPPTPRAADLVDAGSAVALLPRQHHR